MEGKRSDEEEEDGVGEGGDGGGLKGRADARGGREGVATGAELAPGWVARRRGGGVDVSDACIAALALAGILQFLHQCRKRLIGS